MADSGATVTKIVWTDLAGVRRARCLLGGRRTARVAKVCFAFPAFEDVPVEQTGLPESGDFLAVGDEETSYQVQDVINVQDGVGSFQMEVRIADLQEEDGSPAEVCARSIFRSAEERLQEEFGVKVQFGFEIQFTLLHRDSHKPVDNDVYSSSHAVNGKTLKILLEMVYLMQENDIGVEQFHAESGPGQFEFSLMHDNGMVALDKLTIAKEIIQTVAEKHSLLATFLPKLDYKQAANSVHCHIGLVDVESGSNVFGAKPPSSHSHGLTALGESFMAGVLDHLAALVALTVSSPNSFLRIRPKAWVGAYQVWGFLNKEAPLRLVSNYGGPATNFEFKLMDGTSNAYLACAAILHAGMDGIRMKMELCPPVQRDPSVVKGSEHLPRSCSVAVKRMVEDNILSHMLGEPLLNVISAIRLAENAHFHESTLNAKAGNNKHQHEIALERKELLERY